MTVNYSFLLGSERSGTNLITRMLDAHPDVCGPSPTHMIRTFSRNICRYGDLEEDRNWWNLIDDIVAFLEAQLGTWKTGVTREELDASVRERSLAELIRSVYEKEAQAQEADHIFVKENRLYSFFPYILAEFPGSRFIYLVRDPRDVALSWKRSENHPGGVRKAMDVWVKDQNEFVALQGFLSRTGRVALLRYEDLISEPEEKLRAVAEHLRVSFSRKMLQYHEDHNTRRNAERIRNWENLAKPVLADNRRKFLEGLTETEVRYIESRCSDLMRFFGYEFECATKMSNEDVEEFEDSIDSSIEIELDADERKVRERRLDAIRRIIDRPLVESPAIL